MFGMEIEPNSGVLEGQKFETERDPDSGVRGTTEVWLRRETPNLVQLVNRSITWDRGHGA